MNKKIFLVGLVILFLVLPVYASVYDVNHDGIVDMKDVGLVCKAFGAGPEHPRWNPDCDVNQDNCIDMKDIGLVVVHFGQS